MKSRIVTLEESPEGTPVMVPQYNKLMRWKNGEEWMNGEDEKPLMVWYTYPTYIFSYGNVPE